MPDAVSIRTATVADAATLEMLWAEFEAEVPEPGHRTPETWEQAWAEIGEYLASGLVLLAEVAVGSPAPAEAGRPLAYALARDDGPQVCLLDTIYERPEARWAGLAKRVLAEVAAWAQDRHARVLTLEVLESNAPARDVYARLGFEAESHVLVAPLDALTARLAEPGDAAAAPTRAAPPTRPAPPTLHGGRLTLRPGDDRDIPALLAILAEPEVARWWGLPESHPDAAELAAKLAGEDESTLLVVDVGGRVAGGIEFAEEHDPDYRHAGIDIYLGGGFQDRGLGREAVALLARWLFEERGHHRLTIDPAASNVRAIRCYEAVGFRRVGMMRNYERGPDGSWRDGLLLDLLAHELRGFTPRA